MAFKMKGSPMQRNFGINSPIKHGTDDWGFKHGHEYHRGVTGQGETAEGHEEDSGVKMKSPLEDKQPYDKSKSLTNQHGGDVKDHNIAKHSAPTPTFPGKKEDWIKKDTEKSPNEMKSPLEQDIRGSGFEKYVVPDFISGRDTGKLYEGKTYTDATKPIIEGGKKIYDKISDWWSGDEGGPKMKSPLEHEARGKFPITSEQADRHNQRHGRGEKHNKDGDWIKGPKMKSPLEHKRESDGKYIMVDGKKTKQTHSHIDKEGKKMTEEEVTKANARKKETTEKSPNEMKSPLEQTSFIDKVKSAGEAIASNIGAVHGAPRKTLASYKWLKKKAREKERRANMTPAERVAEDKEKEIIAEEKRKADEW